MGWYVIIEIGVPLTARIIPLDSMASSTGDEFDASSYTEFASFDDAMEAVAEDMSAPVSWNKC